MLIELSALNFSYGSSDTFRLQNITAAVRSSEIVALVGANGSGKTTLIKILLRQLISYSGSYCIDGSAVTTISGDLLRHQKIGYSPEITILDDELTGFEILTLIQAIREIPPADFSAELDRFKHLLVLDDWLYSKKCKEYSQGMQKKISLMIALLGQNRFIILDEPTNGLDPLAVFGLKKIVQAKKESGSAVLLSSHILDFVEKLVDGIIILKQGAIRYCGTLTELHSQWPKSKSLDEIYFGMYTEDSGTPPSPQRR